MRTTVVIDDHLLGAARVAARRRGCTLGRLIEDALRRELAPRGGGRPPEVPTFRGGAGPQPGVDLTSNRALLELVEPDRVAPTAMKEPGLRR